MIKRDYREKDVKGMIYDITRPFPKSCTVTVRMTSDKIGQSLSLSAYNIQLSIPLEAVRDIIRVVEKGGDND